MPSHHVYAAVVRVLFELRQQRLLALQSGGFSEVQVF